jgi:hypothetical protein
MRKNVLHSKFIQLVVLLVIFLVVSCNSSGKDSANEKDAAQAREASEEENEFVQLFDGKTLNGWEGDTSYWKIENSILVGQVTPDKLLERNTFLIWREGQPTDFELKGEVRITSEGNSGINYRSVELDTIPFALKGYQADMDGKNRYTGQNYEERGRTTLAYRGQKVVVETPERSSGTLSKHIKNNAWLGSTVTEPLGKSDSLQTLIKSEDWNEIHLIVKGNRMQHYVNGVLMSDVTDNDTVNRKFEGKLGVQVHVGPPMKVEYRNLRIKQL